MRRFTRLTEIFLEESHSREEAAQHLMEWFYDRKASQDPYYR